MRRRQSAKGRRTECRADRRGARQPQTDHDETAGGLTGATLRPRRSALYVPGINARAIAKARTLAADVLIFDLEDAIAPDAKVSARDAVVAALVEGGFGRCERVVRVNGFATPWGHDDITAIRAAAPDAILLPKIDAAGPLIAAAEALAGSNAPIALWAMIETPRGVLAAERTFTAAGPAGGLTVAVFGGNDLLTDLRARAVPGRAPLLPHLAICVAAARSAGLDVLDGVFNDVADGAAFARECEQGRDFGFDGKTLIHPTQIAAANAAFAPSVAEIAWATSVVDAFAVAGAHVGVLSVEGRMVELMHLAAARRTLALAAALA